MLGIGAEEGEEGQSHEGTMWESCGGGSVRNLDCGAAETKLCVVRQQAFWKQCRVTNLGWWSSEQGPSSGSGETVLGLMESSGVLVGDIHPLSLATM